MLPGTRPIALLIVADTGGTPKAISAGKVTSVPEPTTVLIAPAAIPARKTRKSCNGVTRRPYEGARPLVLGELRSVQSDRHRDGRGDQREGHQHDDQRIQPRA